MICIQKFLRHSFLKFFDADKVNETSPVGGMHFEDDGHQNLGVVIAIRLKTI